MGDNANSNHRRMQNHPYRRQSFSERNCNYNPKTSWNRRRDTNDFRNNRRTYNYQGNIDENNPVQKVGWTNSSSKSGESVRDDTMIRDISSNDVAKVFMTTVFSQPGIRSELILIETEEGKPLQTLQAALDSCHAILTTTQNENGEFVFSINGEEIVKGNFQNKQIAKTSLAEIAVEILRKSCFYIVKKKVYEEINTKTAKSQNETGQEQSFEGSKAHQMMLKMGWGGKGLGVNEQGEKKTLAETMEQNITKQGFGTTDVLKGINEILENFAKANKFVILRFAPDFLSEERAHIHKIASKFGLKSKSEGKGDQRRITISKKLSRPDLVYELLSGGCENQIYKLLIPEHYKHLWDETDK